MNANPFTRPRRTAALLAAGAVAAGAVTLALPATPAQAAGWTAPYTLTADNSGFGNMKIVSTGAGDAVAVWIDGDSGEDRVRARIATDGVWGPAAWVSPQGIEANYVEVEANNAGDVVATWLSEDDGVNWKARGARLDDDGTWDTAIALWHNPVTNHDPLDTAIDGDGTVHVALAGEVAGKDTVQVRTWEPGQAVTGKTIAPELALDPSIDVNEAGQAVLAYQTDEGFDGVYATEFTPGVGWSGPEQVSFITNSANDPQAVIDGTGRSTIVHNGRIGNDSSSWRIHAATENQAGTGWSAPVMIAAPAPGKGNAYPAADTDASGRTLVAWKTDLNGASGVSYATRSSTGGAWVAAVALSVPDPSWGYTFPEVNVSDSGTQTIDYTSGGNRITKYRTSPALNFSAINHGSGYKELGYNIDSDVDNSGYAALIELWHPQVGSPEVRTRFLDIAGPTTTLTAPTANTTESTTIPLAWTTADDVSGVDTTDVSVTAAPWNQAIFVQSENAIDDSTETSGTYAGTPGTTYCFTARSIDKVNNLGANSEQRCTTLPVDDASLVGSASWKRVKEANGHYLKTYSTTKEKGAKLTLKGVKAKRLALVIHKTTNGGKAVVKLGTQKLKTVKFEGTGKRKIVKLATFDEVRSGKVTITVITDGKRVDVDGLIVAK